MSILESRKGNNDNTTSITKSPWQFHSCPTSPNRVPHKLLFTRNVWLRIGRCNSGLTKDVGRILDRRRRGLVLRIKERRLSCCWLSSHIRALVDGRCLGRALRGEKLLSLGGKRHPQLPGFANIGRVNCPNTFAHSASIIGFKQNKSDYLTLSQI